jgi:hypothetical protein
MQSGPSATHRGKLVPLLSVHVRRGLPVLRRSANRLLFSTRLFATIGYAPRTSPPNALCSACTKRYACIRSVAERSLKLGQTEERITREPFLMPASLIGPVFTAMAAHRVAATCAASRRPPRASVWRVGERSVVFFSRRPNPFRRADAQRRGTMARSVKVSGAVVCRSRQTLGLKARQPTTIGRRSPNRESRKHRPLGSHCARHVQDYRVLRANPGNATCRV